MTPTVVLITLVLHSPPRPAHQSERYKARAEVVARWRGRAKCFLDVFCSLHPYQLTARAKLCNFGDPFCSLIDVHPFLITLF